jgi:hypothetical protein
LWQQPLPQLRRLPIYPSDLKSQCHAWTPGLQALEREREDYRLQHVARLHLQLKGHRQLSYLGKTATQEADLEAQAAGAARAENIKQMRLYWTLDTPIDLELQ